jgi:hypothetical protein
VGRSAAYWHDPVWKLDACAIRHRTLGDKAIMKRLIPLLERLERATERFVGATLRASAAVLSRAMRRGQHRPWRKS